MITSLPDETGQTMNDIASSWNNDKLSELDKRAGGDASHDFSASACIPYPESFGSSCVYDLTDSTLKWLNFPYDVTNQLILQ